MACLCANDLNRLLTVEKLKPSATVDNSGNIDETNDANWVACGQEWAQVLTKGSREFFRNRQVGEDITHQVTIRWSKTASQYTTGMRLRLDGRKLNIAAPPLNVDEKNDWLVMETREVPSV